MVTLDTNVPYRWWHEQPSGEVFEQLLSLAADGAVQLVVTRTIEHDVPREPLASRVRDLPVLDVAIVPAVVVISEAVIGSSDLIGNESFEEAVRTLRAEHPSQDGLLPSDRDFQHLHVDMLHRRAVFLTWDGPILALRTWLAEEVDIQVMTPEEFLAGLDV